MTDATQVVERLEAVRSVLPPRDLDLRGVWWCPCCKKAIGSAHVTFGENCEFCGTHLSDVQPDVEGALAAHDALDQAATLIRTLMERERNLEGALTVGIEFMNIVFRWLSEGGAREPLPEIIRYRSALLAALERP